MTNEEFADSTLYNLLLSITSDNDGVQRGQAQTRLPRWSKVMLNFETTSVTVAYRRSCEDRVRVIELEDGVVIIFADGAGARKPPRRSSEKSPLRHPWIATRTDGAPFCARQTSG